jgi:hypothetical protein
LGHTQEASDFAHNALDLARQAGEGGHEARALALVATVEARRLEVASRRSGELHGQATALPEELGMRPLVARCQLDAGCLWLAAGHRSRTREYLGSGRRRRSASSICPAGWPGRNPHSGARRGRRRRARRRERLPVRRLIEATQALQRPRCV